MPQEAQVTILHFVHGKYAGQEFPLDGESHIAGRSTEVDLVLADDAVSRKHVRFFARRGRVWVRDLGSRNGTQVNGTTVRTCCLRPGDRLGIGASLARVELKSLAALGSRRAGEKKRREPNANAGHSMTGSIEDIPLMDVLQWLATSRKTGTLQVSAQDEGREGALHLRDGSVFYAVIKGAKLHPEKALMRMLNWEKGMFELENTVAEDPPVTIDMPLEHMLMEAARQQDEIANLAKKTPLPTGRDQVELCKPSPLRWKELPEADLDLLQDLLECGSWQAVADTSETSDLLLYRGLVALKKKGIVSW